MTREELLKAFDDTVLKMRGILIRKNEDYAKVDNALRNLERLGLKGIITRLEDKAMRLDNILDRDKEQRNEETLEDTCIDGANYYILFLVLYNELNK